MVIEEEALNEQHRHSTNHIIKCNRGWFTQYGVISMLHNTHQQHSQAVPSPLESVLDLNSDILITSIIQWCLHTTISNISLYPNHIYYLSRLPSAASHTAAACTASQGSLTHCHTPVQRTKHTTVNHQGLPTSI